ncbi:MAG: peptidylprolyl isomerase [Mycobacteriaceae bacterium]
MLTGLVAVLAIALSGCSSDSTTTTSGAAVQKNSSSATKATTTGSRTPRAPSTPVPLPDPAQVQRAATVSCNYPASKNPAKPVNPPVGTSVSASGSIQTELITNQGTIGLTLNQTFAPCAVNSFVSLGDQGYFDGSRCHRLVTGGLKILQCGDPTATGTGGPGYSFADEYPADQYPPGDPAANNPQIYPRGTIAMANSGPNTNGSQFFLVFGDSILPPKYTVFGTIDEAGLTILERIAAGGLVGSPNSSGDGKPKLDTIIESVGVPKT